MPVVTKKKKLSKRFCRAKNVRANTLLSAVFRVLQTLTKSNRIRRKRQKISAGNGRISRRKTSNTPASSSAGYSRLKQNFSRTKSCLKAAAAKVVTHRWRQAGAQKKSSESI